MIKNGVYIGKDIELVVTDKYVISYRRNTQMDMLESDCSKEAEMIFHVLVFANQAQLKRTIQTTAVMEKRHLFIMVMRKGEIQTYQKNQIMSCDTPPTYLKKS